MRAKKLAGIAVALTMALTGLPAAPAKAAGTPSAGTALSSKPEKPPKDKPHKANTSKVRGPVEPSGLDRTGATVPGSKERIASNAIWLATNGSDTNPGTKKKPVATILKAMELVPAGGTIAIRGGVYRQALANPDEAFQIQGKSVTFINAPGEQVWFDGSDVIPRSAWARGDDGLWRAAWSTPTFCENKYNQMANNTDALYPTCAHPDMVKSRGSYYPADPQQLWASGTKLAQTSLDKLGPNNFAYDFANKQLVIAFDPTRHLMEAAKRPTWAILGNDADYSILGLGFRRFATSSMESLTVAAIFLGGAFTRIEDSAFVDMSAAALHIYSPDAGSVVRHNVFARNGYTALQVNGQEAGDSDTITISDNWFNGNNDLMFGSDCSASCGQASVKMAYLAGFTVTRNVSENARGNAAGFWCDLDCKNGVYTYNIVRGNNDGIDGGTGIYHEVSDTGLIAGNLVEGGWYGIGVASPNTKVYNNTLVGNVQGLRVYDDPRGDNWDTGPNTTNVSMANNIVLGTWSWDSVISGADGPHGTKGSETTSFYDHNLQWLPEAGQDFIGWYPNYGIDGFRAYSDREAFCRDTGFECHSAWVVGGPSLFRKGTFVLTKEAAAIVTPAPLPADVAAALGVSEGTSYLGAFR